MEDLLIFLTGLDFPAREVAHNERHLHQPKDPLIQDHQHFVLLFVLWLQVSAFELLLLLLPQRLHFLYVLCKQKHEVLVRPGRLQVYGWVSAEALLVEVDQEVVEMAHDFVQLYIAGLQIISDVGYL